MVGQGPITAALTYVVGQGPITATSIIILSLRSWLNRYFFSFSSLLVSQSCPTSPPGMLTGSGSPPGMFADTLSGTRQQTLFPTLARYAHWQIFPALARYAHSNLCCGDTSTLSASQRPQPRKINLTECSGTGDLLQGHRWTTLDF